MRERGRSRCEGLGGQDECGQVVVCMDAVRVVMDRQADEHLQVMGVWARTKLKHSEAGCGLPHRVST